MTGLARLVLIGALVVAGCAPRIQEHGPLAATPVSPVLEIDAFVAPDGTRLPLRRWQAAKTEAVLVALHGFNDYSNAFSDVGAWLAGQGITTLAYDQRGFGQSGQRGRWPGSQVLVDDARAAIAAAHAAYPDRPVFALGTSMGGAVLLAAAAEARLDIDGLILSAPAVWGRETMAFYETASLWLFAHTLPWLELSPKGIRRHPSDNIPMLRALSKDPLVIKRTRVDAVWGLVNLMDRALAAAPKLDGRTLILLGQNDDIVPPRAMEAMLARLPASAASGCTVAVYRSGYHMLLRDLQGELVWGDILSWMRRPGMTLPSGADRRAPDELLEALGEP